MSGNKAQGGKSGLVLTPGGWRPKSQVHVLEPGHHISGKEGKTRIVRTATGEVIKDFGKTSKKNRFAGSAPGVKSSGTKPAFPDNAWIENSQWTNNSSNSGKPIVYFKTKWVVPRAPRTKNGQVIFLFNGLQQTPSGPYILQPVLQWGVSAAGGGNYWSVTNWYVNGQGGSAVFGALAKVNPGDKLLGIMTLMSQSGNLFSYGSSFIGFPAASDLVVQDIDELAWACETLECYGLTKCSDYPHARRTSFYDIQIKIGKSVSLGKNAHLNWQPVTNFTDCGQKCVIVSNKSPGGKVDLYYRHH
jgi:hypothetical protein